MFKDLPKDVKEKLRVHSKLHKGGMRSLHMRNMVKFMSKPLNMSFSNAHKKAVEIDNNSMKKNKSRY